MRIFIGLALAAHALIHLSYLSPAPPRTAGGPEWPFEMSHSWLVTNLGMQPELVRPVGTALVAVTVCALLGATLASLGLFVPVELWRWLVIAGAVASTMTLAIFFHPWIVLGFAIDAVLLYVALVVGWQPFTNAGS